MEQNNGNNQGSGSKQGRDHNFGFCANQNSPIKISDTDINKLVDLVQSKEATFKLKDLIILLSPVGAIVGAYMTLNTTLTEVKLKQEFQERSIAQITVKMEKQNKKIERQSEQLNSIEATISSLYNRILTTRK